MINRLSAVLLAAFVAATDADAQGLETGTAVAKSLEEEFVKQPSEIFWQSEVLSKDDVQSALAELYITLRDNGVLQTKSVLIGKGDTPTELMIRSDVWPHWLEYRMPLNVEAMLCDMNKDICGTPKSNNHASDWSRAWPGEQLRVPSIKLSLDYKFGVRHLADIRRRSGEIDFITTPNLEDLWCRRSGQDHEICQDGAVDKGWLDEEPAVYVYLYDGYTARERLQKLESIIDPESLKEFGAPDSPSRIVAIPVIKATIETNDLSSVSISRTIRQLDEKAFINPRFSIESLVAKNNHRILDRMGYLDGADYLPPYDPVRGPRPIRIAHIDTAAELNHCMFSPAVRMKRWAFSDNGGRLETVGPTEVASNSHAGGPDGGNLPAGMSHVQHCGDLNEGALRQVSHGTHTLGLLVDVLTLGGKISMPPGADDPPVTIYHIPIGQEQPNEIAMGPFVEVLEMLPLWRIDVVSMSVSWNQADTIAMEGIIRELGDSIFFVAAAGNQGQANGCSKSPACIDSKNVISVIALDMDQDGNIQLLPDTNRGSKYHDIGALGGNVLSSVNEGMVARFSGTSQATPLVAAAVGRMIQHGKSGIDNIYQHLLTTAWLDSRLLGASKATMINARRALDTGTDFLVLKDGCSMRGAFDRFAGPAAIHADSVEGGSYSISTADIRRIFYNERDDWHLFMHKSGGDFVSAGYLLGDDDLQRDFRFTPESFENCEGITAGNTVRRPLMDVKDLILTSG